MDHRFVERTRRANKPPMTQERLKELLHYDAETGVFKSIKHRQGAPVGKIVGSLTAWNTRSIGLDGKVYSAHILAVLYVTGKIPATRVVALNGDFSDTRWVNLKVLTEAEQADARRRQALYGLVCKGTISPDEIEDRMLY